MACLRFTRTRPDLVPHDAVTISAALVCESRNPPLPPRLLKYIPPLAFRNLRAFSARAPLSMLCCSTELPAHCGRPVVFGGKMSVHRRDHLREDGISANSPAPPKRKRGCLHPSRRRCSLKYSNFAPNSLLLNLLPTTPMGSIFCGDFRLSPPVFSIFYEQGGGEGARPHLKFVD